MKKILIVIHNMEVGGAQKSLNSFLHELSRYEEKDFYEIDVMVIKPGGQLKGDIPSFVNILESPKELQWLSMPFAKDLLKKNFSIRGLIGEVVWGIQNKTHMIKSSINLQQKLWKCWKYFVPKIEKKYDIAVSYMDGVSNYYVIDKVYASKKILWVHNEYQKEKYNRNFDNKYFASGDMIITISEECKKCIVKEFPHYVEKVYVLENIVSKVEVMKKAYSGICPEYENIKKIKLLSIGRLNQQKGFDLAIKAAKLLKDKGYSFLWLIIGEGNERKELQNLIDQLGVSDSICLLGIKENPYVYMKSCDILIQPSRWEGKSIVIDEAKILGKTIVATNYGTVKDSIIHDYNGWITEMTPEAICDGIIQVWKNPELKRKFEDNLNANHDNDKKLLEYMNTMF